MREAAVMLIIKDGLILGISRRHDPSKFGLPGGKVEPYEQPHQAAIRETQEECGIKVSDCVLIFRRDELRDTPEGEDFHAYCYYALQWEGEPISSEEGVVKWLTAAELTGENGAFSDYNIRTLQAFKQLYPNISIQEI